MNMQRTFTKSDTQQILLDQAKLLLERAKTMPDGVERDSLIKAAQDSEAQAKAHGWAESSGLQAPTR